MPASPSVPVPCCSRPWPRSGDLGVESSDGDDAALHVLGGRLANEITEFVLLTVPGVTVPRLKVLDRVGVEMRGPAPVVHCVRLPVSVCEWAEENEQDDEREGRVQHLKPVRDMCVVPFHRGRLLMGVASDRRRYLRGVGVVIPVTHAGVSSSGAGRMLSCCVRMNPWAPRAVEYWLPWWPQNISSAPSIRSYVTNACAPQLSQRSLVFMSSPSSYGSTCGASQEVDLAWYSGYRGTPSQRRSSMLTRTRSTRTKYRARVGS